MFQIGGADVTSYAGILREYARQRGLHRMLIPVPVLTPYLSSLWLGLTTPIYARVGRKLVESLRNATVVRDTEFPAHVPRSTDGPGGGAFGRRRSPRTWRSRGRHAGMMRFLRHR